ncbi:acyltransferase domain-containing protein [Nocardia aurantia]|uniref:[acyl-carrier-protein] S-malonyltransferase n=1 Tax=Nocardia aurantia TaxID=2585199 RepID=A0A7K0DY32_9NOCA|nr:acyltransferase domain-containing protein [Nocardia aurantia]MQY30709.1 hypothetical protein [Nocardia aurantia]
MSKLAFLYGGQITLEPDLADRFHRHSPGVRRASAEAAQCIGLSEKEFRTYRPADPEFGHSLDALRHAALALGLTDDLAAHGVIPDVVGGLSLGALIGACVAEAIEREQLYAMLFQRRLVPPLPPSAPAQAMVLVSAPIECDPESFCESDIHLAVDTGPLDLETRSFVLAGHRAALEDLIADAPAGVLMFLLDRYQGAFHSPLQRHAVDFMSGFVSTMAFHDPKIPVCSPIDRSTMTTAEQIRDFVSRHNLLPARYEPIVAEIDRIGGRAAVVIGPGLPPPAAAAFLVEMFTDPTEPDRLPDVLPIAFAHRLSHRRRR